MCLESGWGGVELKTRFVTKQTGEKAIGPRLRKGSPLDAVVSRHRHPRPLPRSVFVSKPSAAFVSPSRGASVSRRRPCVCRAPSHLPQPPSFLTRLDFQGHRFVCCSCCFASPTCSAVASTFQSGYRGETILLEKTVVFRNTCLILNSCS